MTLGPSNHPTCYWAENMVGVDDLGRVIILISVLDELGFVHRIGRSFPPVLLDGFNLDDYVLAIIPDRHDNAITNSKRIVIGAVIIYRRSVGERYTAEHVDSLVMAQKHQA